MLLLMSVTLKGQPAEGGQVDSLRMRDDFITASLLVTTPGPNLYSSLGHTVVRMECPHFGLDYCFSFQSSGEQKPTSFFSFLSGQQPAGFLGLKTADYMSVSQMEGRGVVQYTLNLNPIQEQELWRCLDNNIMEGLSSHFDFVMHNCTSMSLAAVGSQLQDEHFEVRQWPATMCHGPAHILRSTMRNTPWLQFLMATVSGAKNDDKTIPLELCISPETMGEVLSQTFIVSPDGSERPVLKGQPKRLLPQTYHPLPTVLTPLCLSIVLLLLVALLTVGEWRWHWQRAARVADVVLLVVQALVGVLLLYMVVVGNLFGQRWNWCLLLFTPLPLLVWLGCRRWKVFPWICQCYGGVLLLLAVAVPLVTSQFLAAHRVLAFSGAVRCIANGMTRQKLIP